MILNLIGPAVHGDEALKGITRTRFSFHFTTLRKRRWILVQLVSAPTLATDDVDLQPTTHHYTPARADLHHLLDDYHSTRAPRHCI
jgi:hypothetical protein